MPALYTDLRMKKSPVQKLEEQVKITKVEVRKLSTKIDGMRNKIWLDMENLKDEVKDEMALLRNDVAGMKDEIVTEVKAMREEFVAHQGVHERQQETLEVHEKRISSLEQKPITP